MLVPEEYNCAVVKISFWLELQNSPVKYVGIMCPVILMLSEAREGKL
jgi:hypothetical protein